MTKTQKPTVLILGGRSDIGQAIAHAFAKDGHPIMLAARNPSDLEDVRSDIEIRYAVDVSIHDLDLLDTDALKAFVEQKEINPGIVVSAVGMMGKIEEDRFDPHLAATTLRTNFEAPAQALEMFAAKMQAAGSGTIVGISSVAGDRGRASNYIYGAAKAGFTAYLSGMRNRLNGTGVHVVTVKPGFVATRMTKNMDLPARLTAQPDEVAGSILKAVEAGRNVIYVKPIWRLIMSIIRTLPEFIFKKTSL